MSATLIHSAGRTRTGSPLWILLCLALLFAIFSGLVIALGVRQFDLVLFGVYGGVVLLFAPLTWVFWALLGLTFLVTGQLQYFAKINQAQWIPYLIALLLFLRIPLEMIRMQSQHGARDARRPLSIVQWALFGYLIVLAVSSAFNAPPFLQTLAASKNYFFLWSILFLLSLAAVPPLALERMWKAVIALVLVQLPLAVYQHFFVAAGRTGAAVRASWDAVVGSFGGDQLGGGSSGALALFLVVAMVLVATLWKQGLMRLRTAFFVAAVALGTILLAEVKVVYVLLPLAFLMVFWREIFRRPGMFIGAGATVGSMFLATVWVYQALYADAGGRRIDLATTVEKSVKQNLDTRQVRTETGEMGRAAAIGFWWDQHRFGNVTHALIGYGIGASRSRGIGAGEMAIRYRLAIDRSSLSMLLWDVGVLGLAAFLALLGSGAAIASRLARHAAIPPFHTAVLGAVAPALVLFALALPYNADLLTNPAIQVLLMLLLGQVVYWHRMLQSMPGGSSP